MVAAYIYNGLHGEEFLMGDFQDEHAGKGGSYVIENGKRVLHERTDSVAPQQARPAAPVAPAKTQPKVKGASNA